LAGPVGDALGATLVLGLLAAAAMGLAGFGLRFRATVRRRGREYAVLTLNGLPASAFRASLAHEQAAVLGYGVAAGTLLGLALALSTLPGTLSAGALAGLPAAALTAAGLVGVGRL